MHSLAILKIFGKNIKSSKLKTSSSFNLPPIVKVFEPTHNLTKKWIVVGGVPVQNHDSPMSIIGLEKIGEYFTESEAKDAVNENYEKCGGVISHFSVCL